MNPEQQNGSELIQLEIYGQFVIGVEPKNKKILGGFECGKNVKFSLKRSASEVIILRMLESQRKDVCLKPRFPLSRPCREDHTFLSKRGFKLILKLCHYTLLQIYNPSTG